MCEKLKPRWRGQCGKEVPSVVLEMGEGSKAKEGWSGWIIALCVAAMVVAAAVVAIKKTTHHSSSSDPLPVPGPPGAVVKKYGDALSTAIKFFDVQKCRDPSLSLTCLLTRLSYDFNFLSVCLLYIQLGNWCGIGFRGGGIRL